LHKAVDFAGRSISSGPFSWDEASRAYRQRVTATKSSMQEKARFRFSASATTTGRSAYGGRLAGLDGVPKRIAPVREASPVTELIKGFLRGHLRDVFTGMTAILEGLDYMVGEFRNVHGWIVPWRVVWQSASD
jgi:hypothetical protein